MTVNDLMRLAGLSQSGISRHEAILDQPILALCDRAQEAAPGGVFFALKGAYRDGHDFLEEACRNDALAVVVEKTEKVPSWYSGIVLVSTDTRNLIARSASVFYGSPTEKLFVVGVTGTSGKTTTTNMVEALLNATGCPTAVIGTIDHHLKNKIWHTDLTTPGVLQLQRRLKEFSDEGALCVSMEVSSHALHQKRVAGVSFDVAVFTNISRDHLWSHDLSLCESCGEIRARRPRHYNNRRCDARAERGRAILLAHVCLAIADPFPRCLAAVSLYEREDAKS